MMKIPRRKFFLLAAGAAALPVVSPITKGQTYPSRPVHWIVGFPPGGPGDITARIMGQYLSERLHQPFVVENRPGAASNIATEAVVNASPDGYTLLLMTVANTVNPSLYDNLKYNSIRDIAPVAIIIGVPLVMEVNPSFPAKSAPEFLAYAKENPGKINFAHSGTGTPQHVSAELFKFMTGINMIGCALSWIGAGAHRLAWRTGAGHVRHDACFDSAHPERQAATASGDPCKPRGSATGSTDDRRVCARLRNSCMVRRGRAEKHTC